MARMNRRRSYRRERQETLWIPYMESVNVSLPNNTTDRKSMVVGSIGLNDYVDHDATIERIRGRVICVKDTTGVGQFIVAGRVIDADLAAASAASTPELFNLESTGDDFPLWLPFACVDSDVTSMWNGHTVDVKARRKINTATQLQLIVEGRSIDTSGVNENYFIGFNLRVLVKFS